MSALVSKLAVATAAAVGLYVTTVGLPVTPHSCLRTVGVAAAAPLADLRRRRTGVLARQREDRPLPESDMCRRKMWRGV